MPTELFEKGVVSGNPAKKRKLRSGEAVSELEAMRWVATHKASEDETVQHRTYRDWMTRNLNAFMERLCVLEDRVAAVGGDGRRVAGISASKVQREDRVARNERVEGVSERIRRELGEVE